MSANLIKAEYPELASVATALDNKAYRVQVIKRSLTDQRNLFDGEWVGFGADRFFAEMDDEIIPALQRIRRCLGPCG